jgi:glutathione synthase/RimK-type ligase-like ATP-grasp enzyme
MIGIVSHDGDLHASTVRQHLDASGAESVLLDTADLPTQVELTTWTQPGGEWSGDWNVAGLAGIDVAELNVMWWRRPQPFRPADEMRAYEDRMFVLGECAAAVAGLWSCLDAVWVNDPDRDEAASRKMWQLKVASELGLRVPRTCMTNSPQRAREFLDAEPGPVIYKAFSATPETWRETRVVSDEQRAQLDQVRLAPVIFQEAIAGGCDLRVTVVGDRIFPAQIVGPAGGYEYDFRVHTGDASITAVTLPHEIESMLRALMHRFGLWYGAIDLRRTPDGDYVFLEINPAGQWLFVEYETAQPISKALATMLADLDRRHLRAA